MTGIWQRKKKEVNKKRRVSSAESCRLTYIRLAFLLYKLNSLHDFVQAEAFYQLNKGVITMQGFIKVSNNIFSYSLTPKAFSLYLYLLCRINCFNSMAAAYHELAEGSGQSVAGVRLAIAELEEKKLITKQNRYNTRGYIKNRYHVHRMDVSKGWFKVCRAIVISKIKPTDLVVYCYINKCMNSAKKEAFPSLSAIAEGTGISRSRVSMAVTFLRQYTYLNRIKRRYKRTKAWRHNRYLHFKRSTSKSEQKKKPTQKRKPLQIIKYIISHFHKKVKSFFENVRLLFRRGVVQIIANRN